MFLRKIDGAGKVGSLLAFATYSLLVILATDSYSRLLKKLWQTVVVVWFARFSLCRRSFPTVDCHLQTNMPNSEQQPLMRAGEEDYKFIPPGQADGKAFDWRKMQQWRWHCATSPPRLIIILGCFEICYYLIFYRIEWERNPTVLWFHQ